MSTPDLEPTPKNTAATQTACTVALIGNPNTGKSTLFSAVAGVRQHVGNYPGVTVEKKTGRFEFAGRQYDLVDLPGLYSLAPRSRDEMVAVDLLLGQIKDCPSVDAVICVADAGNLERSLYLVSQVLEFGLPTVLAVNMLDVARGHGIEVDLARLAQRLPIPLVAVQANRRTGVAELKAALARVVGHRPESLENLFPEAFRNEVAGLEAILADGAADVAMPRGTGTVFGSNAQGRATSESPKTEPVPSFFASRGTGTVFGSSAQEKATSELPKTEPVPSSFVRKYGNAPGAGGRGDALPRYLVERLLLDVNGYVEKALPRPEKRRLGDRLKAARLRLETAGCSVPGIETRVRYDWANRVLDGAVVRPERFRTTRSDRIDHVLAHSLWGMLVFAVLMVLVFQAVFLGAEPAMRWIDRSVEAVGHWVESGMADGALRSLLVDGVLGGVGGVAAFLPQIAILFFFIAVLEDCGYMARTAYLMDRMMVRVGLNGKSFIPLLSSFACAVPGIMATRVIEDERDRLTTILVAPLITCSARLPVYALLIAAFVPQQTYLGGLLNLQGLTLAGLYLLGIVAAVVAALIFKRTILRGEAPPFLMELPSYKWPSLPTALHRVMQRCWVFARCAGTLILAVSIIVWAAIYYPHDATVVEAPFHTQQTQLQAQLDSLRPTDPHRADIQQQLDRLDREIDGAYQRQSLLARAGRMIEPVVRPLGWDWRIGCAVIASFPAREIVVATMGVIFEGGDDLDSKSAQASTRLQAKLRAATREDTGQPLLNTAVALSILVFFALSAQCAATLAVIRRETNSWRWPAFTFAYMTALAYVGALLTYHAATWMAG